MNVRFVICVDIEDAKSLEEAYRQLHTKLSRTQLGWESADEFYVDGDQGDVAELDKTRLTVLAKKRN